jgi:hypothetical protein
LSVIDGHGEVTGCAGRAVDDLKGDMVLDVFPEVAQLGMFDME